MTNPFAHDRDCDFWFDHYESECTCSSPGLRPVDDPAQVLRAIQSEIAVLKRRIEDLEARVAASTMPGCGRPGDWTYVPVMRQLATLNRIHFENRWLRRSAIRKCARSPRLRSGLPDYGFQSGRGLVPLHSDFDWLKL